MGAMGLATAAQESDSDSRPSPAGSQLDSTALPSPFLQADLELLVGNVQRPNGIAWHDGHLMTVCAGDWTLYRISDRTGYTISFVYGVRDGNALWVEDTPEGFDIWVPDPDQALLWKVDHLRSAPDIISRDLGAPWGITRWDSESFLITDTQNNSIKRVSQQGEVQEVISGLRSPTGIASADERVYFANGGSARRGIEYTEWEAGQFSALKPLVGGLQNISSIEMGSDGKLYFAYALGTRGVIGRVDPQLCIAEGCSSDDIELVLFADILAPLSITLSDDLRLFLHSRFRPEIYWLQLPYRQAEDA